jgi:CheY-like chemotaxis protein
VNIQSTERSLLIVEDDVLVLEVAKMAFEARGWRVLSANSSADALEVVCGANQPAPLALLTDINLGEGPSGWDLAASVRNRFPAIAVLYVSGNRGCEWVERGVPGSRFLQKPFGLEDAVDTIADMTLRSSDGRPATRRALATQQALSH